MNDGAEMTIIVDEPKVVTFDPSVNPDPPPTYPASAMGYPPPAPTIVGGPYPPPGAIMYPSGYPPPAPGTVYPAPGVYPPGAVAYPPGAAPPTVVYVTAPPVAVEIKKDDDHDHRDCSHIPDYMGLSIFNMLCCFFIIGIIALIKSSEVQTHRRHNEYDAAQASSRTARTLNIFGIIFGSVCWVLVIILIIDCSNAGGEVVGVSLLCLPDAVLVHILTFLTVPELVHRVSLVCTKLRSVADDESLWERHLIALSSPNEIDGLDPGILAKRKKDIYLYLWEFRQPPKDWALHSKLPSSGGRYSALYYFTVVGPTNAGKSSLLQCIMGHPFVETYTPTIGVDFSIAYVSTLDSVIKLLCWDLSGNPLYLPTTRSYLRGPNIIVLCYSVTDRDSFNSIHNCWEKRVEDSTSNPMHILGLKSDSKDRVVSAKEARQQFGERWWGEVSSKTGDGVTAFVLKVVHHWHTKNTQHTTPAQTPTKGGPSCSLC
ncbi:Ras subfamily protein [Pelomyxa schiedti]|nr:Ras subfamily protein [Pelomyxa schiedti]